MLNNFINFLLAPFLVSYYIMVASIIFWLGLLAIAIVLAISENLQEKKKKKHEKRRAK